MEIDQNCHDLAEGESTRPLSFLVTAGQQLTMPSGEEDAAEIIDITKQLFQAH
jgi:hypothetical protein